MAKIQRIAANETQKLARITLGYSYNDLAKVAAYKPSALTIVEDKKQVFALAVDKTGTPYVGVTGVSVVPSADKNKPVVFTVPSTGADVETAELARVQAHLNTIEEGIKEVLDQIAGAEIEEC